MIDVIAEANGFRLSVSLVSTSPILFFLHVPRDDEEKIIVDGLFNSYARCDDY